MAASAADAAKGADVVITMLPNGDILRAVAAEIIPAMKPGAVAARLFDRRCGKRARRGRTGRGRRVCRRRCAGLGRHRRGHGGHADLHGGRHCDAAFATVQPLFDIMGQKAVHCGDAGTGRPPRSATT